MLTAQAWKLLVSIGGSGSSWCLAGFGCGGLIIPRCGELMVAGSLCGGLIIVRCGELMLAEVITWCGGIMSKRLALS